MASESLPPDRFIMIWQGSVDLAEVCSRTGYSATYASQRASRLRKRFPDIKKFKRGPTVELEVLDPAVARGVLALEDMDAVAAGTDGEEGW